MMLVHTANGAVIAPSTTRTTIRATRTPAADVRSTLTQPYRPAPAAAERWTSAYIMTGSASEATRRSVMAPGVLYSM